MLRTAGKQTQFKANQTQNKPKQTQCKPKTNPISAQNKPNQTQFQRLRIANFLKLTPKPIRPMVVLAGESRLILRMGWLFAFAQFLDREEMIMLRLTFLLLTLTKKSRKRDQIFLDLFTQSRYMTLSRTKKCFCVLPEALF